MTVTWKTEMFKVESASALLINNDDGSALLLNVHSDERGQGHATALMNDICTFADEKSVILILSVLRFGDPHDGLDNNQLRAFYEKFGFVVTSTKPPVQMERPFKE